MTYLVIGLGVSGKSAIELLIFKNKKVIGIDKNLKDLSNFSKLGIKIYDEDEDFDFDQIDTVVLSPGIKQDHKLVKIAKSKNISIISEVELGMRYLDKNKKIIAISATNGKTTTCQIIEHILNRAKIKTTCIGNIGKSVCRYVIEDNENDEVIIIELSSFQLMLLNKKFIDIGAILNIEKDHLDFHGSLNEYISAKCKMKNLLNDDGVLFLEEKLFSRYRSFFLDRNNIRLIDRKFDRQNQNFAYEICKCLKVDDDEIISSLATFNKSSHRIEFVDRIKKIDFYNDSKSTNPSSTLYAVNVLKENIILIAGGDNKNLSFKSWDELFGEKVKKIIVFGKSSKIIKKDLARYTVEVVDSLLGAINRAFIFAKANDKIILSPGCASFDMFKNYIQRGDRFKQYVRELKKGILLS
jgi:UDP-N-acetylmuramoylalanine--D-glutamate ligase